MKILQLCSKIPFPPKDGGSVAMNILTQGLLALGHDVRVLAIRTPKHNIRDESIDSSYRERTRYRSVFVDTDVKPLAAMKSLVSGGSYNIERFDSKDVHEALQEILRQESFDVVQLETLWAAPYLDTIRKYSDARVVLRSQNVEYRIWEMLADETAGLLKKGYIKLLAGRLKRWELAMLNRYDAILPITEVDQEAFRRLGCNIPMHFVPFGIDTARYIPQTGSVTGVDVFHLGAMDWLPNAEAIRWVLQQVWPRVQELMPGLMLHLAGRNMPEWMNAYASPTVRVHGEVADAARFLNEHYIMIVPLASGGGMRVKIIEGMALSKTIISTGVGASGIECRHGKDILIADTAEDFAQAIVRCASDRKFADDLGRAARELAVQKYDNDKICRELVEFYQTLISK